MVDVGRQEKGRGPLGHRGKGAGSLTQVDKKKEKGIVKEGKLPLTEQQTSRRGEEEK